MLRTVRVPAALEPAFAAAEDVVSRFFRSRADDPEHGTIEIFGERYILVRAASLSVEFFALVEQLFGPGREGDADEFARNLLFDLAHALGKADAGNFHEKMGLGGPIERLSAGPVHFAHAGWAFVDILPQSHPVAGDDFYLLYDHPYSFESDAWLRAGKSREFPVCIMNAGYSSGWCEESFGLLLVASEVMCRARGDDVCRFIMAPPRTIEQRASEYLEAHRARGGAVGRYDIPDFFARKRAEDELRRLYQRLTELDDLKTRMFANVSHELRTPLAIILGVADRLRKAATGAGLRNDLDAIARNARLMLGHVNDLLEVAKLEAGRMELVYAEVDLARLARRVASYFDVVAADRGITYRVEGPDQLLCEADADKVQRLLANLLSNAFKFVPDGGTVRCSVSASEAQHRAQIAVADSGPGVPPEARQRVFERFVDLGQGHRGGTGLGLAIARDLSVLHGGTITVDTAPEGGALFVVELPLRAPPGTLVRGPAEPATFDEAVRPAVESLVRGAEPAVPHGPDSAPLVLVVEDNVEMSNYLAKELAAEYRVATAYDGLDGLQKCREIFPDLIITDLMMPLLSGSELVRAIRSDHGFDGVPIIVLTARADDDLRIRLLGEGAQDYLAKPVIGEELLARARNQVVLKRTRDILQSALMTKEADIEHLAEELARTKRELQDALNTTRVARDQAERANQAKTKFLSLVSHELRTPLQSVSLNLEALQLQRDGFTATQSEMLNRAERGCSRLVELVESLLELVKQESGRLEVHREQVALRELALIVIDDLRAMAAWKNLDVRLSVQDDLPPACTDPSLVRIVIVNLVSNAIKYTDHGSVEVRITQDERGHRIEVADTGRGIPRDKQALIFEPFTRLEPIEQKHVPGFGIGLSLVHTIVRELGGSIRVASEVGEGSTFTVLLPRS